MGGIWWQAGSLDQRDSLEVGGPRCDSTENLRTHEEARVSGQATEWAKPPKSEMGRLR